MRDLQQPDTGQSVNMDTKDILRTKSRSEFRICHLDLIFERSENYEDLCYIGKIHLTFVI